MKTFNDSRSRVADKILHVDRDRNAKGIVEQQPFYGASKLACLNKF